MEFSLSGSPQGETSRMLKQCRPVSELGDEDHHQQQQPLKMARTEPSFSGRHQQQQELNSDDQSSGFDPTGMMMSSIYEQQQQQQLRSHLSYGHYLNPMKHQHQPHISPSAAAQFQQSYYPFTASQWAELEHQALIFKYMMARAPVPPELVNPFRRSLILSPNSNSFQLGVSTGSPMDAEPGRCRRTDGKKWRCSRPIVADQKYCERHIHRGRNRSRKAAEAAAAAAAAASNNPNTGNAAAAPASAVNHHQRHHPVTTGNELGGSKTPGGSSYEHQSSKSSSNNSSTTSSSSKFFLDQSGAYQLQDPAKDQRFVNGMSKEQFDLRPEQLLFSEVSGSCTRQQQLSGADVAHPTAVVRTAGHGHVYGCDSLLGEPLMRGGIQRQPEHHFFVDWHDEKDGVLKLALEKSEELEDDPYTSISLARISSGGDLLADVIKSPCELKPPSSGGAGLKASGSKVFASATSSAQQQMILASPTGVLQKVTCFSDSSSSASSPGSVKNEASHAH